jgi:hypothetical protein
VNGHDAHRIIPFWRWNTEFALEFCPKVQKNQNSLLGFSRLFLVNIKENIVRKLRPLYPLEIEILKYNLHRFIQ